MVDRPHESTPSQSLTAPLVRLRRHERLHGLGHVTLRIARRQPGDRDELVARLAMLEMIADNAIDYTADLSGMTLADAMADVAPKVTS